jgi:hypothetical protein
MSWRQVLVPTYDAADQRNLQDMIGAVMDNRADLDGIRQSARRVLATADMNKLGDSEVHRAMFATDKETIGVVDYLLDGDVAAFHDGVQHPAREALKMYGETDLKGDGSLLSLMVYQEVLHALAGGAFALAKEAARCCLTRNESSPYRVHPFDKKFAFALFSIVCAFPKEEQTRLVGDLITEVEKPGSKSFIGYGDAFAAILDRDVGRTTQALSAIAKGQVKLARKGGLFDNVINRAICIWGIGVANLARALGMDVSGSPPLIPDELLISVEPAQRSFCAGP